MAFGQSLHFWGMGRARHSMRAGLCQTDDGAHGVTRPTFTPLKKIAPTLLCFAVEIKIEETVKCKAALNLSGYCDFQAPIKKGKK
jgi:hypothetical protein